jgi:hypothetical protein
MMVGLWLAAWFVTTRPQQRGPDRLAWIVVLLIQSVPYASSLLASLASAFPLPARLLGIGYRTGGSPASSPSRRGGFTELNCGTAADAA